jgi:hypothetical protein
MKLVNALCRFVEMAAVDKKTATEETVKSE